MKSSDGAYPVGLDASAGSSATGQRGGSNRASRIRRPARVSERDSRSRSGPPRPHPFFLAGISISIHPSNAEQFFFLFGPKNSTAQFAGPPPPPAITSRRQRPCGAGAPPTASRRSPSRSSASCRRYRTGRCRFRNPNPRAGCSLLRFRAVSVLVPGAVGVAKFFQQFVLVARD